MKKKNPLDTFSSMGVGFVLMKILYDEEIIPAFNKAVDFVFKKRVNLVDYEFRYHFAYWSELN